MRVRYPVRVLILSLCAALLWTSHGVAADLSQYVKPSWPNMLRTMVRFNALNLQDPMLIDEYTVVTDCDIYAAFHQDDFKWNQVKQAVVKSVEMNVATFPQQYTFDLAMQLDRYDFQAKIYRLTAKTAITNVNTFVLFDVKGDACPTATIQYIPRTFRAVLDNAFYFDGLPLSETDAQKLYKQMEKDGNTEKIIFARFYVRIVYIDPLRKTTMVASNHEIVTSFRQSNSNSLTVRLDARLDGVAFFSDEARTHLIYEIQP